MRWERVAESDALPPGAILSHEIDGRELVVWRTESGSLSAVDARCPHQWAHLGAVGAVDGEELVCLSHFWRFDGTGCGSKLSMTGRRDPKSEIECFAVREIDGSIEVSVAP